MTLNEIRRDLKEVRYYYYRKDVLDKAFKSVSQNNVVEKVNKYNDIVKGAPPQLYDVYISLYTMNLTQEALSVELGYTPEYVQMLNKKLLKFIQSKI